MATSQPRHSAVPKILSIAELRAAFESFSDADEVRLEKAARYLKWKCGVEIDELINEAVMRALNGDRRCRRDLPPVVFLIGVMKSLASDIIAKRKTDPIAKRAVGDAGSTSGPLAAEPSADPNPEEALIAKEERERAAAVKEELEDLFADNERALMVLWGEMGDLSAEEIREQTGMDKTTYASARRHVRRKIDRHYPNGWRR